MKKLIFLIGFLAIAVTSFSQTVRTRTYFHNKFITGYKPTQTDYRDLWASIFFPAIDSLDVDRLIGVDELSNDPTLADSSSRAVVTEAAVKAYVDAQVGGGGVSDNVYSQTEAPTMNLHEGDVWLDSDGDSAWIHNGTNFVFLAIRNNAAKRVVLFYDCSDGAITYFMPFASAKSGWEYVFLKVDASDNLLNVNADYIDSDTSKSMWGQYTARTLYSNGVKWCWKL